MKKIAAILITICIGLSLCIGLTGCNYVTPSYSNENNEESTSKGCSHSWIDATCETPKTCSKCKQTTGSSLGHSTTTGKCTRCNKSFGTWELDEFFDEFNQPTGEKYVYTQVNGTFSNSATTNSKLIAAVQLTSDDVAIMLWEYGSHSVKCSYKWEEYDVTMKDANGRKHYLDGTMYEGSSRIYFDNNDESTIINALKQTGSISFYVVCSDRTTTNYLFTVETSNFNDLYQNIK